MTTKRRTQHYAIGESVASIGEFKMVWADTSETREKSGWLRTPTGYVTIRHGENEDGSAWLGLGYIHDGREYWQYDDGLPGFLGDYSLAQRASRFRTRVLRGLI